MTSIQPIPFSHLTPPTHPSIDRCDGLGARVREEGRHAGLEEILRAVVVNALGPDTRVAVPREDWVGIEDAILGPVSAAATAALDRLAADLEASLPQCAPELVRRIGGHRLRIEFGYD